MSAVVKLSSKLPGNAEINGLDAFAEQLLEHPEELIPAIVFIDAAGANVDFDAHTHVPIARIRRIEPLGSTLSDVPQSVKNAMAQAEQKRTGRKAIPFEVVEVPKAADPYGDELPDDED